MDGAPSAENLFISYYPRNGGNVIRRLNLFAHWESWPMAVDLVREVCRTLKLQSGVNLDSSK